jgi:hypothetical protein
MQHELARTPAELEMVCGQETRNKGETWMRLLKYNLLAVAALLFLAANAGAYQISMTTDYDGGEVEASDYITVKVWLDTEGQSNIAFMEVGVIFDTSTLAYERSLSTTGGSAVGGFPGYPNYILYAAAAGASGATLMEPRVPVPNGFSWDPPHTQAFSDQVHVAWVASNVANTLFATTSATATNALLATLVFHVIPNAVSSQITLTLTEGGTVFELGTGPINDQVILSPSITVNVAPEPGVLAISFAALVTLGGLRRYERRNR